MSDEERRYDRRREDRQLIELENAVRGLTTEQSELKGTMRSSVSEIGRIRTTLGDRLTTLMHDLDERYMPRTELEVMFVPRKEHQEEAKERATWRSNLPLKLFAGGTLVIQGLALILHH